MRNLHWAPKIITIIRIIGIISLLCLMVFFVLYFSGWLPSCPKIDKENIDDFLGDDLWGNVSEKFDDVAIDNLPLKSQVDSITNYNAILKVNVKEKNQWIETVKDINSYIAQYLSDNPKCALNDFDSVTVKFKFDLDINSISFSNVYDFDNKYEKLNNLNCIRISSDSDSFFSLSDIILFDGAEYIVINSPIDDNTDFSVLENMDRIVKLDIFVDENVKSKIEDKISNMSLSYEVVLH